MAALQTIPSMATRASWAELAAAVPPPAALQRQLLVDNPMRLYWPEERSHGA